MNTVTIFALLAVVLCCSSSAWALPVDVEASQEPIAVADEASSVAVEAIPISLLDVNGDDLPAIDGDAAENEELQRSARGLGLGFGGLGGKFGLLGLGHGFGGVGGLGFGGFHGFGGGLGLLKFKPFFHKFG